jgi:hypothetical protein
MNESFLHFIWKYRLLQGPLTTTEGETLTVIHPGWHNHDAGPDFSTAKIKIGDTLWAGNVEIHVKASDWQKHQHQQDPAYKNIILHVVYENDQPVKGSFATIVVKNAIDKSLHARYIDLIQNKNWVPCEHQASTINYFIWESWKQRLVIEKLENKQQDIQLLLDKTTMDWETAFYISMARSFGFRVNGGAFELLAKSLPLKILARHKNKLLQTEALLFGQAGFLNKSFTDAYPLTLQKEYQHLRDKYQLKPIDENLWRFLRLRPPNFPHIRLSQFAHLIYRSSKLFSYLLDTTNIRDIENMLTVKASKYWNTHYRFEKISHHQEKLLGTSSINLLMINTVIPFLFSYGNYHKNQGLKERAINFLESLPSENNHIITKWKKIGIDSQNASDSQALLFLYKNYCIAKKCLHCPIGKHILA